MIEHKTDEIDLGVIFNKIKESFDGFLINIYKAIQFIIKRWWIVLLVAILGGAVGWYLDKNKKPSKTATLIVQNNFQSSASIYSAIEQLNNKIVEKDREFLDEAGFQTQGIIISSVQIEPIVNLLEIMEKTMYTYRTMEPLLEKTDYEDEVLTSEVFNTDYKYHRITLKTSYWGNDKTVKNLMNYLNNNDRLNTIKAVVIEDTKEHIEGFNNTIEYIDGILKTNGNIENNDVSTTVVVPASVPLGLGELVNSKLSILNQREKLRTELAKYDNVVTLMNIPKVQVIPTAISMNLKTGAILFVLGFLFLAYLKHKYSQIKEMAEAREQSAS